MRDTLSENENKLGHYFGAPHETWESENLEALYLTAILYHPHLKILCLTFHDFF